jgi:hypothetical protein
LVEEFSVNAVDVRRDLLESCCRGHEFAAVVKAGGVEMMRSVGQQQPGNISAIEDAHGAGLVIGNRAQISQCRLPGDFAAESLAA